MRERIELNDTALSACMKLAEGNPGAITALMKLMGAAPRIDPDSAWGAIGPLFSLDRMGIYGSNIWLLWKDVCGQDAVKVKTLFRAAQLGIISETPIKMAAASGEHSFDFDALLADVRKQLPAFAQVTEPA